MSGGHHIAKATLRIGNSLAELEKVVLWVEAFGAEKGLPRQVVNDLNLCLDEVLNNTVSYGYPDRGHHDITVDVGLEGDVLIAEVRDDGMPFDPRQETLANLSVDVRDRKPGGLGIRFVKALMDKIDYVRVGKYNQLTLKKKISRRELISSTGEEP
jgi:anti-sigma regulatory factor (Ser/Thr protein kinase)